MDFIKTDDRAIPALILASALILPTAWDYYLILALPALLFLLTRQPSAASARRFALVVVAFSLAGNTLIDPAWRAVSPLVAVLVTFWPLVGALLLVWAVLRTREPMRAGFPMSAALLANALWAGMVIAFLVRPALAAGGCGRVFGGGSGKREGAEK